MTPLVSAAIAAAFSLAVGNLFPAMPAMIAAAIINSIAARMARVSVQYEEAARSGALFYGIAGTYIYAAITVEAASWL